MNTNYIMTQLDNEIVEQQRLLSDRNKFYAKLTRIGYIPDDDMRNQIEAIRRELEHRIESLADSLIAIGG